MTKYIIEKSRNGGYTLRIMNDKLDIEELEIVANEGTDREVFEQLVKTLADSLGGELEYQKYGDENLRISWDEPGHKF